MQILILFAALFSSLSFAVPEARFRELFQTEILPYFHEMTQASFQNTEGLRINYHFKTSPKNKAALVILPGRTEPAAKYSEVLYDLKDEGLDLFILDHQGQGESDRILADTQKGHVKKFAHYIADLKQFVETVVKRETKKPLMLLSHSMGGAIAVAFMRSNPGVFKKAVLVAPMLEMNTAPYSEKTATLYTHFLLLAGKGDNYAPGYGPYREEDNTFEKNVYTHSLARFEATKYWFTEFPHLIVSGPTARWVSESLQMTKSLAEITLDTPLLLFQASLDQTVKPGRQHLFCKPRFCRLVKVEGAFHEILMESDSMREMVLTEMKTFLMP